MVNNEVLIDVNARVASLEQQLNNLYGPGLKVQLTSTVSLAGLYTDVEFMLELKRVCCVVMGCTDADLCGPKRNRHLVLARHIFLKIAHDNCPTVTLVRLGAMIGKDHSTAHFGINALTDLLAVNNREATQLYNAVINMIKPQLDARAAAQVQA